jgi:hypothetical protein
MGGYQHTGVGAASGSGQYVEYAQMNAAIAALLPSGTKLVFPQAAAPTGWTQITTNNDCALRIVSGTGGGSYTAGQSFSSAVASGSVDGHIITLGEMPYHTHSDAGHAHQSPEGIASGYGFVSGSVYVNQMMVSSGPPVTTTTGYANLSYVGGGAAHSHTFTSAALNIKYADAIIASKN